MQLEKTLEQDYKKYESNLNSISGEINSVLTCLSCATDMMFFLGEPEAIFGKTMFYMIKIPIEINNLTEYVKKSGDKAAIGKFLWHKTISFIPGLSWYDSGVKGIIKERINNFYKQKEPSSNYVRQTWKLA